MTDRYFTSSRDDITHSGWLKKQGGPFKTWQRRFFILQGDILHYFLREDDPRPIGSIPVANTKVEKRPHNADEPGKYLLEILPGNEGQGKIVGSHDTVILWATSVQECEEWVQTIRRAVYKQKGGGIFGQSLLDTITNESTTSTKQIPSIVEQCVEQLRERGLQEEGIFRLPGRVSLVKELQERFDCGEKPNFTAMKTDIHTVSSLLKLYLRLLPEPLIPWQHYESFYNGIKLHIRDEQKGKKELIQQLALLPRTNYNLLKYLCEFLLDVQSYESYNKMGMLNLATVFGPNIFRPPLEDAGSLMETTTMSQKFLHLLIRQHEEMFPPNDQIDFQSKSVPTPPPRRLARPSGITHPNLDLLKEVEDRKLNSQLLPQLNVKDHNSLLIDLESSGDCFPPTKAAAFTQRSYSVDANFGFHDDTSLSDTSTIATSSEHLSGNSDVNSKSASVVDLDETITVLSSNSPLRTTNQNTSSRFEPTRQEHVSSNRSSYVMDLMTCTENLRSPISVGDRTSLSHLELVEEIRLLKLEMRARQEEHEQKLVKWKIKCEGLEIQLTNEESAKRALEERNKQLLKQLNAFIAEYGPK